MGIGRYVRELRPKWSELRAPMWWSIAAIVLGALAAEGPIKIFETLFATTKPAENAGPSSTDWSTLLLWSCIASAAGYFFVICFVQAAQAMRSRIASIDTDIKQSDEARRGEALILALSHASAALTDAGLQGFSGKKKLEKFEENYEARKTRGEPPHPWQQTVRAINHHVRWTDDVIDNFPYLSILTSAGERGSHEEQQRKNFKALLDDLYGDALNRKLQKIDDFLRFQEKGIDFENVDEVFDCIVSEIEYLRRTHKWTEKQIVMDATGGQKPCSIAVGYVTLRSPDLLFQYVTNDGEVKNYNVDATSIEFAKLGG